MTNIEPFRPSLKSKDIDPAQLRAARSILGWSRNELARKTHLSAETIKNIKHGIYSPKVETLQAIINVFARRRIQSIHYKTLVPVTESDGFADSLQMLSYAGVVFVKTFTPEIREEGQQ